MFESKTEPVLSKPAFYARIARSVAATIGIVAFSLLFGSMGYHYFGTGDNGPLAWDDALLNASMILTGMGPVDKMTTLGGKLFATLYALYSGVAFLSMVAVLMAPIFHRFLHKFHCDGDEDSGN